jgi:hypothetical protein
MSDKEHLIKKEDKEKGKSNYIKQVLKDEKKRLDGEKGKQGCFGFRKK